MKYKVNVYLFSEEEFDEVTEVPIPIQYDLDKKQHDTLINCINAGLDFIAFGDTVHHKDDIIKFQIIKTDEMDYKNI